VDVSEPVSISSGIAGRYATAMFDLAKEEGALAALETDIDALDAALDQSADFAAVIASPILTRDAQGKAISAVAAAMGLNVITSNALALMASKRRLFVLPQLVAALRDLIAAEKGEMTAEVTAATALTDAQVAALSKALSAAVGKDVKLKLAVDEALIGGLVVKVGSQMIDTSIRAKLNTLQNTMKEVG
jgi:F-type H+-transporting ATPase subunit delta